VEGPPDTNLKDLRINILKSILKEQGFFEGKR
jgi:hypothetical protein